MLYLPSDLFKYSIDIKDETILREFIQFIKIRHQHKGHYFNSHIMHERLWITNLDIQLEFIQELVPYFDLLESIKLVDSNNRTSPDSNFDSCIINKFTLQNFNFIVDKMHFVLPKYLIDASKLVESESCWKPFYKIFFLSLSYKTYSQTISILKDIKETRMQISNLYLGVSNLEELEDLIKPEYISNTVSKLRIWFKDTIMLTDTFFDNINQIRLKDIDFSFDFGITASFDIIRILKNIQQNIKITLNYGYSTNSCTLCFAHVPIKIVQSNCEDPLFIECSQFTCYVKINKLNESFWFSSADPESAQGNSETFIHVKMSIEYKFDNIKILDESKVVKIYKMKFPDHSPMSECELIIIPMKYLYSVDYDSKDIQSLMSHKYKLEFMNQISKAQKVSCSVSYYNEIQYLSEWVSLFPQKCWFSIEEFSKPDTWDELETYIKKKLDEDCFDDFSNIKLNCIYYNFFQFLFEIKKKIK